MNTTISVICYKSKTLSNGEHPLMLRIIQNRKTQYKSLNISVAAKHWDFDKNAPKPKCPHKDLINKIILKTKLEYQQKVLEKKANGENGIFPYYIQDKVKPLSPMNNTQYEKKLLPRLTKQLETKGYKPIGSDAYSNGKFTITDLTEENMALDNNGNFIFFDPRVYFWGGTLHKRNFRTLNALI